MTTERLEYLRGQIRGECISYGEIAELEGLAAEIEPGDVELLEWAGVPEFGRACQVCGLLTDADENGDPQACAPSDREET